MDEVETLRAQIAHQRHQIARLERMLEVSQLLNSTLNLEELLLQIQSIATSLTATEASSILLFPTKTDELYFETATGEAKDKLPHIVVPLEGSIAGAVVKTAQPIVVNDARQDPRHYGLVDDATQFSTRSILAVPLITKGEVVGAVEVLNKREGEFTDDDVAVLTTMADHAAVAIENAWLFHQSDFIAEVTHELRAPLSSIVGYAKMLTMSGITDQAKAQFAETIHREATRLGQLVNDFLEWARLESGRARITRQPVDLRRIVEESVKLIQPQADERGITVTVNVGQDLPAISGDPARLKQVLVNLNSNAVKYNRDDGRVKVEARVKDGSLCVAVSDTGHGIAEQDLPHIFERFYRVTASEKRAQGTGLGLCIAKQIVELHGGEMTVESQPDAGSTFTFTLPLEDTTASDAVL